MAVPRAFSRLHISLAIGGVALAAVAAGIPSTRAATIPIEKNGVWAQDYSGLKPEADVRFGQLANGMRYALLHNATPVGQVSIRLLVSTGSMGETDAQQGLAHFLEHMAFKGSTRVPEDQTIKILERLGLAFGADTNAFTSMDQTVYQFDLPKNDEETVDTGLMLSRDIASELSFNKDGFEVERGPVLSEERLRDGPGTHAYEAQTKFLLRGQLAADRSPIGKIEIIRDAPMERAIEFYRDYYRPERAALVVAGDIDPDAIEAKIKARFGDWRAAGTGKADPDFGIDRKSTRLNSSHVKRSRMPSSA